MILAPSTLALSFCLWSAGLPQAGEGLGPALESIVSEELRADLYFFADEVMGGRPSPSQAQRVAARFLSTRLMRLGWQAAGDLDGASGQRSWFHQFEVYQRALDLQASLITLRAAEGERRLRLGKDYFLADAEQVRDLELEGELVFCGRGERLVGLGLEGRWALCIDTGKPEPERDQALHAARALGVLLMHDPAASGDPIGRLYPRTQRAKTQARLLAGQPAGQAAFLPMLYLRRSAAQTLLGMAGLVPGEPLPVVGSKLKLRLSEKRAGSGSVRLENVCALWPGSDPRLRDELIILSAHYDHLSPEAGSSFPGADDNGSGSMGLLALAAALSEYGATKRSVLLLWMSAEEHGLLGSAAFVRRPGLAAGQRAICDINLDMLGRNASDELLLTPSPAHPKFNGLSALLHELAQLEGFSKLGSADEYWQRSDHYNFSTTMGLPVAFLFADVHTDYHKPSDTPDKVNYDKLRRATRLVLRLVDRLQADPLKL